MSHRDRHRLPQRALHPPLVVPLSEFLSSVAQKARLELLRPSKVAIVTAEAAAVHRCTQMSAAVCRGHRTIACVGTSGRRGPAQRSPCCCCREGLSTTTADEHESPCWWRLQRRQRCSSCARVARDHPRQARSARGFPSAPSRGRRAVGSWPVHHHIQPHSPSTLRLLSLHSLYIMV